MKQPEQATATKHPHADFLAEALKDTSRKIEGIEQGSPIGWHEETIQDVFYAHPQWTFRFADTVKPEVTSPLTDTELANLWCLESGSCGVALRNIANAAHKAAIKEVAAMASKTSLNCSGGGYSEARMQEFGDACIAEFQKRLLKQSGE